jgi:hypothetical protein
MRARWLTQGAAAIAAVLAAFVAWLLLVHVGLEGARQLWEWLFNA